MIIVLISKKIIYSKITIPQIGNPHHHARQKRPFDLSQMYSGQHQRKQGYFPNTSTHFYTKQIQQDSAIQYA